MLRPRVREDTLTRDGQRCRCCSKLLLLYSNDPFQIAHIHEMNGGALRRLEAVDLSLRSTITLCCRCHEDIERNRMTAAPLDPESGYNGGVVFAGRRLGIGVIEPVYSYAAMTPQEARRTEGENDDDDS